MSNHIYTRTPELPGTTQQAENLQELNQAAIASNSTQLQPQYQYGYPMSYESYVNQSADAHHQAPLRSTPLGSAQGIVPARAHPAYQKTQLAYPYYRAQRTASAVSTPGYSSVYYTTQGYPTATGTPSATSAQGATPEYQDPGYFQAAPTYTSAATGAGPGTAAAATATGYYYGAPTAGTAAAASAALDPAVARRGPQRSVLKPKITTTMWEDEKTLCYQVEANGVIVVRRADNDMINGTKLLNVTKMTRGRRDGILKAEKVRDVVKIGSLHLKGIWIPFDRAAAMAKREGIYDLLYPLFVKDIASLIQQGTPVDAPEIVGGSPSILSYGAAAAYKPLAQGVRTSIASVRQQVPMSSLRTRQQQPQPPQQAQQAQQQRQQQGQPQAQQQAQQQVQQQQQPAPAQQAQSYYYYPSDLEQGYYAGPSVQRQMVQAPAQSEQHQFSQQPYFPYYSQMQYMAKSQGMEQAQAQPQPQPQPQASGQRRETLQSVPRSESAQK